MMSLIVAVGLNSGWGDAGDTGSGREHAQIKKKKIAVTDN